MLSNLTRRYVPSCTPRVTFNNIIIVTLIRFTVLVILLITLKRVR